jgi:predicted TIM-barrel fold metal-dependent hydrolase
VVFIKQLALILLVFLTGCSWLGGAFKYSPEQLDTNLSPAARQLMEQAFQDVDVEKLVDYHVHIVGLSPELHGTFVNEAWQSFFSDPIGHLQFLIYKSAAAIKDNDQADAQYVQRLNKLIQYQPGQGQFGLMAFDYFHTETGQPVQQMSTFRVPNDYMLSIVKTRADKFFPIISIHPYREDALRDLKFYADQNIRFIKWLPNSMGINPSSEKKSQQLKEFYALMKRNNMVLISHTGDEKATHAEERQHLGNPAYLKMPLDMGVKVVMAHLASLGVCKNTEVQAGVCQHNEEYIDIAIHMMKQEKYKDNLFADISALTQYNRQHNIRKIILATEIHHRLINGSDYPLPAVNIVIRTGKLYAEGYITKAERKQLNEIYDYNPLLFDYVLKRTIKIKSTSSDKILRLPASIFMHNPAL